MSILTKIGKYIIVEASINIFKTMILSLIIYLNSVNLKVIEKLFYRGLCLCVNANDHISKKDLCISCKISTLDKRQLCHLLSFMHKQKDNTSLLKTKTRNTRLHVAPVFNTYKPNNEKVQNNILYRGAIEWNALGLNIRNLDFKDAKWLQKKHLKE